MRKIIWMVMSVLMALSLAMTGCSQAPVTQTPAPVAPAPQPAPVAPTPQPAPAVAEKAAVAAGNNMVKLTLMKLDGTKIEKMVEKPKYGGTLTVAVTSDLGRFAAVETSTGYQPALGYNVLIDGDWTRGPAGTGEIEWNANGNFMGTAGFYRNSLAEKWSIVDDETIRFKIRQGVHFFVNDNAASRLVGGREINAEDMAYSLNYQWDYPTSYHRVNMPDDRMVSAKALDKYNIEVKVKPNTQGIQLIQSFGRIPLIAREAIEKYGDQKDWKNNLGTGSMMLKDYVAGSSRTYVRNPNYFEVDPWFPENHLPYIDIYKKLVIPDASTQQAALRTGKIDQMGLNWEDAGTFKKNYPQIMQRRYATLTPTLVGRMDKPGLPWGPQDDPNALKVRRAMNMAINKQELIDKYYGGNADLFAFPWPNTPEFKDLYRPLDTYSQDIQELFQYKPDKAKQLLKEAGYPTGFKAIVTVLASNADFAALLKDYLSKVGIDLQIDVRDSGVMSTLLANRSYPQMLIDINREQQSPVRMNGARIETQWDYAFFEHPVTRAAYNDANKWLMKDDNKVIQAWKSINDVYLQEVKEVMLPMPYSYYVWWPWLKRWEGASNIGSYNTEGYVDWIWIDQGLKKSMGY